MNGIDTLSQKSLNSHTARDLTKKSQYLENCRHSKELDYLDETPSLTLD